MSRAVRYALLSGTLFLVLATLLIEKPGLPLTLKADEPAYFLMTMSLARDGDLRCDDADYRRLVDTYPYLPTENLILMSDDGGKTVLFAKPYLYSLLAAPLAAAFGANGIVAFNALLFSLLVLLGTLYLRRFNSDGVSALFASAFFLLSPTFVYVFWLQPELLNMVSAAGCLFFAFHRFERRPPAGSLRRWIDACFNERTAPAWSGAILAVGTYNKPMLAILGLPALLALVRRRGSRAAVPWLGGAVAAMGTIVIGSVLLSGHITPYLGTTRTGVKVETAEAMDTVVRRALELTDERSTTGNTWSWMFRLPSPAPGELVENLRYFFIGRHVGLLPYFPFTIPCMILFLLHRRRSPELWLAVAALAATALFFILTIPLNWHGGGGFVGNRYFAMVYPAFLFLATSLRPLWLLPPTIAVASLFLGQLLLTPLGAPVLQPTLQAHVRNPLYGLLPFELSLRRTLPGYDYMSFPNATFIGRRDVFRPAGPDDQVMWIQGASRADILLVTEEPIEGVFFRVVSETPNNRVRLELAGDGRELVFSDAHSPTQRTRLLELKPRRVDQKHVDHLSGKQLVAYELRIEPATGRRIEGKRDPTNVFYLGAKVRFLGRRDQVGRAEHYRLEWLSVEAPRLVAPSEIFTARVRVRNVGQSPLSSDADLPVFLSYHWIDAGSVSLVFDGHRSRLSGVLEPQAQADAELRIEAPSAPGRYRLVLDAVREPVAWFSQRGNETFEQVVEVADSAEAAASRDTPEP